MKKLFSLMATTVLLFTQACSFEEMKVEPDLPQEGAYKVQIHADIYQQPATKVTTDGFCTGDEVGVYLVNYDGDTPGTLKLEDNQADNVKFSYSENGDWVSEYDIFYKDNETNVDFYGYYPYAEPTSIEAYPFEVARDQSKGVEHGQMAAYEASDFLWANTKNVKPTESKVILTFRHQMSSARIRFSQGTGWDDAAEYAAVTKEVLVTSTIRKSTINLATGVVTPEGDAPLTGIVPMKDYDEFRAIVVPQTVPAGQTLLTLTIDGRPRHYVRDVDTEYVPGKITTYDLSVSKKPNTGEYEVELTGVNIVAWEADNVSHADDAREYVVVYNELPGQLERTIVDRLEMNPAKIKNLKLTGKITAEDYDFMREKMTDLQRLNLKEVESLIYGLEGEHDVHYSIPNNAFQWKSSLMKCILPDKLEIIGSQAFQGTSLTGKLLLPEGVKEVHGFRETKITSVYFPSSVEVIGDQAFLGCSELMGEISFPENLKKIGSEAFYDAAISGNLHLPESLTEIGTSAFKRCRNLTGSLVIPRQMTVIKEEVFRECGFNGTLTLPEGLREIGDYAFLDNQLKGELILPSTLTRIRHGAFMYTWFNGTLVMPSELVSIGNTAFNGCWRLSGIVEFPENIIAIPAGVFGECGAIEGVRLHKDIEVISADAFNNCYGITSIVCEAETPPIISPSTFNGVGKDNLTLEVPESSVSRYKNAKNWDEFRRIAAHKDFTLSRKSLRALNGRYSKTIVLRAQSGESWSVESKPEWITVTPSSGTGKTEVVITFDEMTADEVGTFGYSQDEYGQDSEEGQYKGREGAVVFILDDKEYRNTLEVEQYDCEYNDGDVITFQKAKVGQGVNVVIMGDCFDARDIAEGKYWDAIEDAYGYFFDIEPYTTYKDYFNVYGVFGVSPDTGIGTVNTIREARFGSQYALNTGVYVDTDLVFSETSRATGNNDVSSTLVIMVENSADYSGICYMWGDGTAIAVVPMSTEPAPYDFRGVLHHEAGGHGFGKLADEYIYHNAFVSTCKCTCCGHVEEIELMKSFGFYENISLTGSMHDVPWSHLIFDPQFSNFVDVYEGGFFHSRGVYRSEPSSCMNDNISYYSAISREAIVKRIMDYAGEEYSFEDFKANDKESLPSVTTKSDWMWSEGTGASSRFDQMPPKFMGDKPSFKKSDF